MSSQQPLFRQDQSAGIPQQHMPIVDSGLKGQRKDWNSSIPMGQRFDNQPIEQFDNKPDSIAAKPQAPMARPLSHETKGGFATQIPLDHGVPVEPNLQMGMKQDVGIKEPLSGMNAAVPAHVGGSDLQQNEKLADLGGEQIHDGSGAPTVQGEKLLKDIRHQKGHVETQHGNKASEFFTNVGEKIKHGAVMTAEALHLKSKDSEAVKPGH